MCVCTYIYIYIYIYFEKCFYSFIFRMDKNSSPSLIHFVPSCLIKRIDLTNQLFFSGNRCSLALCYVDQAGSGMIFVAFAVAVASTVTEILLLLLLLLLLLVVVVVVVVIMVVVVVVVVVTVVAVEVVPVGGVYLLTITLEG